MLPTYPKIERYRSRRNSDRIRERARELSPMIGLIKAHVQFEGRTSAIQRETGDVDETPVGTISAEANVKLLKLVEFTEEVVEQHLADIAEQFARGMSKMFEQRMHEVTEKTGNVVDGHGQPFSEELFLDVIEKLEHRFSPDGQWQPPTMVVGPGMAEKIAASGPMTPAAEKRLKKILERKLDEFRSREAARILVG